MKSIKKFWEQNNFVVLVFLVWRAWLFLLGAVSFRLLTFKASFPYIDPMLIASGYPQWFWHWGNFDGVHYLGIAQNGYAAAGTQVFFPLYPVLIKLGASLIQNYFLAAFLISNLAILFAAIILYRLSKSKWAVLFLFAFPTSFFFGSVYTESLFLLLILSAFYLTGAAKWLFSFLAGLTRLVGAFVGAGIGGVIAYAFYLWQTFGNPLYFLSAQGSFANNRANSLLTLVTPPQVVVRYLKIFLTATPSHPDFLVAVLEFSAFLFGIAVLLWLTLRKKTPVSWLIFSWLALFLPTFSGTLSSMPRYLLTIFPIYLALAAIKSKEVKIVLLVLSVFLLSLLTTFFVRGYWVG